MESLTPEIESRIAELKSSSWQQIKQAADKVGIVKPEGSQWIDIVEEIAIAEMVMGDSMVCDAPIQEPPKPAVKLSYYEVLGIEYPEILQPIQGNYCPNCQDKLRTDLVGNPHCPAADSRCPRWSN